MATSVDLDEVAHYEPPHQHLHCLQNQIFSSLVLKELTDNNPEKSVGYNFKGSNFAIFTFSFLFNG